MVVKLMAPATVCCLGAHSLIESLLMTGSKSNV